MVFQPQDFVKDLPDVDSVKERINNAMAALYSDMNGDNELRPHVCCVCDEFIFRAKDIRTISKRKMKEASSVLSWNNMVPGSKHLYEVEASYVFPESKHLTTSDREWVDSMALSPRGTMVRCAARQPPGFVTCEECKHAVEKKTVPLYAIINQNYVGCPPPELLELNDVERAFLTPVSSYGYFFSYSGGSMKQMSGQMTFMRVEERKIAKSVATLESMGLTKHVVILTSGKMTYGQQQRVRKLTEVRTDKMIAAVKWLCANHKAWSDCDYEELKQRVMNSKPIRVEKASTVESQNAGVEEEIVFTCYYPDGATNVNTGGFSTADDFKKFVEDMKEKNFDLTFKAEMEREFVKCRDGDLLIGACLLQFPYGIGSMDETRRKVDGTLTSKSDLVEFLDHLSRKSDPLFQSSLLQLILYSLKTKARILQSSRLQLKRKVDAKTLATGFNIDDFSKACEAKRNKKRSGGRTSNSVLDAVDATSRDLPHTDSAAKKARSSMEAMLHKFGMGSVFLTVTFDDENSLLMQVMSGVTVDKGESVQDLSDEVLEKRAKHRQTIRFEFPGIAAVNFEMLLSILLEEVLCWDIDNNKPIEGKEGLFGLLKALAFTVEEQGRKTLHGHFVLWIEGYDKLQHSLFFGDHITKAQAKTTAQKYYDHLATTSLFSTHNSTLKKCFEHECSVATKNQSPPNVVCLQNLRDLRHKKGYEHHSGQFAYCDDCSKSWTYEDLVVNFLEKGVGIKDSVTPIPTDAVNTPNKATTLPKGRLHAMCVEYQRPNKRLRDEPTECINAVYQCHVSCHHKNCFRCGKLTGKRRKTHVCGPKCECRYRLPDMNRKATLVKTEHEGASWYMWTGERKEQPIVQFVPKRNTYDLFQNVSCTAISESKFTCNSNINVITDGPIAAYTCKYATKGNQKDDTMEYAEVEATMKKMSAEGAKHQDEKAESLRIICRAAFAHNKANVISSTMASYLTRHESRFYFSEDFVYCPLKDVMRLHNHQDVKGSLSVAPDGSSFFENMALHYLCRPYEYDELSLKNFTEQFEFGYVSKRKKKKGATVVPFVSDTGAFIHPSAKQDKKGVWTTTQGVRPRIQEPLIKVPQFAFPDTGKFGGSILTCADSAINRSMEIYAQLVLTLLVPHRSSAQLESFSSEEFPYTYRFREIYDEDEVRKSNGEPPLVFTEENKQFLQNVQNSAHNSLRYVNLSDELQSLTTAFEDIDADMNAADYETDDEEQEECMGYEQFLSQLEKQYSRSTYDDDDSLFMPSMSNFTFKHIRNHGKNDSGYQPELEIPDNDTSTGNFISTADSATNSGTNGQNETKGPRKEYTVKQVVQVLLKRSSKTHRNVWEGKNINVSEANGTIKSIREWSKAGFGSDKEQQRAFETIIGAFLLTFFDSDGTINADTETSEGMATSAEKRKYRRNRNALLRLKGHPVDPQLIALLHGAGGSGKSTVVNLVTAYAKSFCKSLNHPFDRHTIVICAMSGVAATLLNGETAHSALHLNKKNLTTDIKAEFNDTRLVIIDEISFAGREDIEKVHECLKQLVSRPYKSYGGVNVVFAGDYSQLDPVQCREKVFDSNNIPEFHHALNCFIELNGKHRFSKDPQWGERLLRFRNGNPTAADIRFINDHCLILNKPPPKNIQIATYKNKDRDAINSAIFEDWCSKHKPNNGAVLDTACVILMDNLMMTNSSKAFVPVESNQVRRFFYENCGENDCKIGTSTNNSNKKDRGKGRIDPTLKLYPNCPMMLTLNTDVPNGQANGSRVFVKGIRVLPGESAHRLKLDCGATINALFASQVKSILVEHENPNIIPSRFEVQQKSFTFKTQLEVGDEKLNVTMKGSQFPIVSNSATTGHKLQGCTVDKILVNDWFYGNNWAYVVLSRVRTMDGLYIRTPLSFNLTKYEKSKNMMKMLQTFREKIGVKPLSDEEYDAMIMDTEVDEHNS